MFEWIDTYKNISGVELMPYQVVLLNQLERKFRMKYCKDCKKSKCLHDTYRCQHQYVSRVSGESISNFKCEDVRHSEDYCGADAKWFEPKEPEAKLHLEADIGGNLIIYYDAQKLGYVDSDGECNILSTSENVAARKQWVEAGKPTDHSEIAWRGKVYYIDADYCLCCKNVKRYLIYSFKYCQPCFDCKDDNIIRHEDNLTPVIF